MWAAAALMQRDSPQPTITVEGFCGWMQNAANHEKAHLLTPRHVRGLQSIKEHLLAPLDSNLLSSDTFARVINTTQHVQSHGQEACAINRLREVHGLPRMLSYKNGAAVRERRSHNDTEASRKRVAPATAVASSGAKRNGGEVARHTSRALHTAHRTASAATPALQPTPAVYEQDAVVATAAGEGSEDPFWLAVVSQRTSSDRKNIPVLWLERDARFSARGEIFWCGQHGIVGTAYVTCQLREYWKPKQIGGWTPDSAFICSHDEVQLVLAHLRAATTGSTVTSNTSAGTDSAELATKRRRHDLTDQRGQVAGLPCPLCAAGCGKMMGHVGPHRRDRGTSKRIRHNETETRSRNRVAATGVNSSGAKKNADGCKQPCPLCVAGCGKKTGHQGPHRLKPHSNTAESNGSTARSGIKRSYSTTSNSTTCNSRENLQEKQSTSNAVNACTPSRTPRSTAGKARRIFDPSYLGPAGQTRC